MSLGIREYARHRKERGLPGATHRAVQVAIKDGRISAVTKTGRIRSARAADEEWAAATKSDHVPITGPTAPSATATPAQPSALARARERRELVSAELAELELAKLRGSVVEASQIEARWSDEILRARTRLLGIPVRAREADPTLADSQIRLFDSLIREALDALAEPT